MLFENNLEERELLGNMAKVKDEIQSLQLWVDDARTNRIARIRYQKGDQQKGDRFNFIHP